MSLLTATAAPTQAEALYAQLKQQLMVGHWRPGQKLSIRKLSEETGGGMSPVREALKRLASERVLESSVKRSFAVPKLNRARTADLFSLRALLESEAALLALDAIDQRTLTHLATLIPKMQAAIERAAFDSYMSENQRFHFLIYRRCGNADMVALIEQLWMQTGPSLRAELYGAAPDASWSAIHTALLEALAQKDRDAVRQWLLRDIRWEWLDQQS